MIRATKTIVTVLALSVGLSCFPGRFDDLENETWVQFADRDNGEANGDLGVDVVPMDLSGGLTKGGAFTVSSQGAGAVTQITFDEKGGVSNRVGAAGSVTVSGGLVPLNNQDIFTLAPYPVSGTITGFVAGQPRNMTVDANAMNFNGLVAKFLQGPKSSGTQVGPSGLQEFGNDIVVGDFGSGVATPDIIILGAANLTVVNGAGTARTCRLLRPNFPPSFAMGFKNAALAPVLGNTRNQLVVSGVDDDNTPRIYVFESSDIADSQTQCHATLSMILGAAGKIPPITLAIGEFDGTPGLDLVTGTSTNQPAGTPGAVNIYPNINFASPPAAQAITNTAENPSPLYGVRILIDDLDGDGKNELIVADPTVAIDTTSGAGRIYIYTPGSTGCANTRGPVCLAESLWAPEPGADNHFGRALATTTYKTAKGTRKILGVGERNRLNVYFRINSIATDPREL